MAMLFSTLLERTKVAKILNKLNLYLAVLNVRDHCIIAFISLHGHFIVVYDIVF